MRSDSKRTPYDFIRERMTRREAFFMGKILALSLLVISACLTAFAPARAQDECLEVKYLMTFDYRSFGIGVHRDCGSCDWWDPICNAELLRCETMKARQIALGLPLVGWIIASRAAAIDAGVSPIPPEIREQLAHLYPPALLDKVRYKTGSGYLGTLQWLREEMGNKGAITLIDVIVFSTPDGARTAKLWAHELEHVRQYEQLGVDGFAQAYVDQTCILPGDTFLGGYDSSSCKLERQAESKAEYWNQNGFVLCCRLRNAPATLVLRDRVLNGKEDFVARDSITIGPNVALGTGGNVTLRAGRVITFSPEFRSDTGGKLLASIEPALNQTCSLRP